MHTDKRVHAPRALELLVHGVVGDDAAQVGADGVHTEVVDLTLAVNNDVGGVTLEALGQGPVALQVGLQPLGGLDVVAEGILGRDTAAAPASRLGDEEEGCGRGGRQRDRHQHYAKRHEKAD